MDTLSSETRKNLPVDKTVPAKLKVNGDPMMGCRFCSRTLSKMVIDLGESSPSNSFLTHDQLSLAEERYPLKVFVCKHCFLVQLAEYKKAADIFTGEYIYFSSYSRSWLEHAKAYTAMIIRRLGLSGKSFVSEIASNDGYLLQHFKEANIPVLGIEPTRNTAEVAQTKGIETVVDFFGLKLAKQLLAEGRPKADLIIGNNVLAHVPDINDFMQGLSLWLHPKGTVTMEFPHLVQLMEKGQFDTIYHEHFSYLSFYTVRKIFHQHGLEIYDVDRIPTHGGSLRIYAKHKHNAHKASNRVNALLDREVALGIQTPVYYEGLGRKAKKIKADLLDFLQEEREKGKTIIAYGAAAKGNTLINYCRIGSDLLPFVVDRSPHKQGKFLPGSHIPVVAEDHIQKIQPDFVLILPWNIKDEIMTQLSYIRRWNGQFVTAIPELTVEPA